MPSLTITESLAEIKTLNARISKKRESVLAYLVRYADRVDPLEKDGGSQKFVGEELQAIRDLEERIVNIRTAIQQSNLKSNLSLDGSTRSVTAWLNWRREISERQVAFLSAMSQKIAVERARANRPDSQAHIAASLAIAKSGEQAPRDVVTSLNEKELSKEIEDVTKLLGDLDGKLALFNATTVIDV